jgi:predicted site-specific integrase-resolvase
MTLRRWETEGRIDPPIRTQGGRRRYDLAKLRAIAPHKAPSTRATIAYARVSTNGQKDDLVRQVALLESYCAANGWVYEIISDLGSGLKLSQTRTQGACIWDLFWRCWSIGAQS